MGLFVGGWRFQGFTCGRVQVREIFQEHMDVSRGSRACRLDVLILVDSLVSHTILSLLNEEEFSLEKK